MYCIKHIHNLFVWHFFPFLNKPLTMMNNLGHNRLICFEQAPSSDKHPSSSLSRTDLIITLALKGTLHENTTWPENAKNVQIFICRLPIIVLHIFMKHKYFFHCFLSFLECSHFGLLIH